MVDNVTFKLIWFAVDAGFVTDDYKSPGKGDDEKSIVPFNNIMVNDFDDACLYYNKTYALYKNNEHSQSVANLTESKVFTNKPFLIT